MPDPQTRDVLPFTGDDAAQWKGNIEKSRTAKKTVMTWWDANIKAYAPRPTDDPAGYGTTVNTNRDFTLVERKKADLFYQKPDITAIPSPLMVGQEALLDTHTQILNEKLGLDGVNAKQLVHQVLFDVLCPSGTGWTIMGYDSTTVPTEVAMPVDPNVPVDPAASPVPPQMQTVDVPVYEECYWKWLSPKQALIPHDVHTTLVDDWPWVGWEFEMPVRTAKRKGWVPADFTGSPAKSELHFDHGTGNTAGDAVATGVMIFYKSALYRDDRVHPLHQTLLVLIDGVPDPAEHKDSPHQTITNKGALSPDSLIGYPMHPLTIRTLTDSAYVPSDCTISRPLVNELNTFREQMIQFRDASVLRWMYNVDELPVDALNKIVRSPVGGFIGVPGDAFVGDGAIKELPHGSMPRENFQVNDYLDNDLARTHALDAEQSGASGTGDQTATEASIKQSNVNARLGLERGVVLDWYIKGVTKFSTLIQRYLPLEQAVAIVGPQQAQAWDQWRKVVPATLAFTAMPDSANRPDLAWERKRALDEYSFFVNDQNIDKRALLKDTLKRAGKPMALMVQQPPTPTPEPPKLTLSIAAVDLDPFSPSYGNIYQILTQQGIKNLAAPTVDPATAHLIQQQQQVQAEQQKTHGGRAPQAENLSKHQAAITGGMQGTGEVVGAN